MAAVAALLVESVTGLLHCNLFAPCEVSERIGSGNVVGRTGGGLNSFVAWVLQSPIRSGTAARSSSTMVAIRYVTIRHRMKKW